MKYRWPSFVPSLTMEAVSRRISNPFSSLVMLTLALTLVVLPALVPVCSGANAAMLGKHDCCKGARTCHTQFQRSPCCEYQPSPGGSQPFTPASLTNTPVAGPALITDLPELNFSAQRFLDSRDRSHQSHAPPLYLQKQSLLC